MTVVIVALVLGLISQLSSSNVQSTVSNVINVGQMVLEQVDLGQKVEGGSVALGVFSSGTRDDVTERRVDELVLDVHLSVGVGVSLPVGQTHKDVVPVGHSVESSLGGDFQAVTVSEPQLVDELRKGLVSYSGLAVVDQDGIVALQLERGGSQKSHCSSQRVSGHVQLVVRVGVEMFLQIVANVAPGLGEGLGETVVDLAALALDLGVGCGVVGTEGLEGRNIHQEGRLLELKVRDSVGQGEGASEDNVLFLLDMVHSQVAGDGRFEEVASKRLDQLHVRKVLARVATGEVWIQRSDGGVHTVGNVGQMGKVAGKVIEALGHARCLG